MSLVRVSGDGCWAILSQCFTGRFSARVDPWKAVYGDWCDAEGLVDDVVLIPFRAPRSYTGQDMFELVGHGNPVLVDALVRSILGCGARRARPGEFTMRAVLNGKLSLLEAEGINELIMAHTRYQADMVRKQVRSPMVARVAVCVEQILQVQAHIEATIDYGEEDVEALQREKLLEKMGSVLDELSGFLKTAAFFRGMKRGFRVLITGAPNVGKSSLFNAMVKSERSIVTDLPGTTRDLVHQDVEIRGLPVVLVDSAGVRDTQDVVENIGIERIYEILEDVDLVLYLCVSGDEEPPYQKLLSLSPDKWITIKTKADLADSAGDGSVLSVSARTGAGLMELEAEIVNKLSADLGAESVYLINQRQEEIVLAAVSLLQSAVADFSEGFGEEILSSYLNSVRHLLGELTGETSVEDILDRMFSNFCLGK